MSLKALRQRFQGDNLSKAEYLSAMLKQRQTLFGYLGFLRDTDILAIEIRARRCKTVNASVCDNVTSRAVLDAGSGLRP